MWKTITKIKKVKYKVFKNLDKINLKSISKNLTWKNTNIVDGINYVSPRDNIFECESNNEKIDDNNFIMKLNSKSFNLKNITNNEPKISIDFPVSYIDLTFCLRKYVWMYNTSWKGEDDANNRIWYNYFSIKFYNNSKIIGEVKANTRADCSYGGKGIPISVIVYDDNFVISEPLYKKIGATNRINHTNSVDYYMDIGVDITVYTRKKIDKFDFKARLTVDGWVQEHDVTTESFLNIKYAYNSSISTTTEGTVIFYEDR